MIKSVTIIFDNNTLVSAAILKSSLPAKAFDFAIIHFKLIHSQPTLVELQNVFNRKKFDKYISQLERHTFINYLVLNSYEIEVTSSISTCRDPKDNKFLELAVDGNAEYIITGDKDLLVLHPFRNISIITPAMFVEMFRTA